MRFIDVSNRLPSLSASGAQLVHALSATGDWWRTSRNAAFTPGAILIHIGQATRFNLLIVRNALGEIENSPVLDECKAGKRIQPEGAFTHESLRQANFVAAERHLGQLVSPIEIGEYLAESFNLVRQHVRSFPISGEEHVISHPLVILEAPAPEFLYRQIVEHALYHYGQVIALMKAAGYATAAPHLEIFGRFH